MVSAIVLGLPEGPGEAGFARCFVRGVQERAILRRAKWLEADAKLEPVARHMQFDRGDHPALPKSLFIRADCSLHVSVSIKRSVAASIAGIALQSSIENVWSSWGLTRM